jgi:hypothetical protein
MTTRTEALTNELHIHLDRLVNTIEALGFADAEAAVSDWQNDRESDTALAWHNPLASAIRHGIDLACDTDRAADSCHIRIDRPMHGQTITYAFPATGDHGQGGRAIEAAVASALTGRMSARMLKAKQGEAAHG